jgi:hypothetical protein
MKSLEDLEAIIATERELLSKDMDTYRKAIQSALTRARAISAAVQELERRAVGAIRQKDGE